MRRARSLQRNDRGFALVYALIVLTIVAAGAYALTASTRSLGRYIETQLSEAQERAIASASVTRSLFALGRLDDPLWKELHSERATAAWSFDGRKVELKLHSETGRIDLNHGSIELLRALFRWAAPSASVADAWSEEILRRRENGSRVTSIDEIIGGCRRLSSEAARLRAATTTWTEVESIDPRWLLPDLAAGLLTELPSDWREAMAATLADPNRFQASRLFDYGPAVIRVSAELNDESRVLLPQLVIELASTQFKSRLLKIEHVQVSKTALDCN